MSISSPAPVDLSDVEELLQEVVAYDQEGYHDYALGSLSKATVLLDALKVQQEQRRDALKAYLDLGTSLG